MIDPSQNGIVVRPISPPAIFRLRGRFREGGGTVVLVSVMYELEACGPACVNPDCDIFGPRLRPTTKRAALLQ